MHNAFVDGEGVLKAHGFVEANDPDDVVVDVAEDFELDPRKWKWDGVEWSPHTDTTVPQNPAE